jgi:hypothetical protein
MKEKIRYTDEPMEMGPVIRNFLPPPDKLIFKEGGIKVTLNLSVRTVHFFKAEAEKRGLQYQRMIRRLLDAYVDAFQAPDEPASHARAPVRTEEPRRAYRRRVKHKQA